MTAEQEARYYRIKAVIRLFVLVNRLTSGPRVSIQYLESHHMADFLKRFDKS